MLDTPTLITILWSMIGAIGVAALSLIGWGIKKLITAVFDNTVAVKILTEKVGVLSVGYDRLQKLETDLNVAHSRIRKIGSAQQIELNGGDR